MLRNWRRLLISFGLAAATLAPSVLNAPMASAAGRITLSVSEANTGEIVVLDGSGFISDLTLNAYFSSDAAAAGDQIDSKVTAYSRVGDSMSRAGVLTSLSFVVPAKLTDGKTQKNVSSGDYYVYLAYSNSKQIQASARFFVLGPVTATPSQGNIGDFVLINATGLKANDSVNIFFSSNRALPGSTIDGQVVTYQKVGLWPVTAAGALGGGVSFKIPSRLTDGKIQEDIHGGDYYFYLTYYSTRTTVATTTRFVVPNPPMNVSPESGNIGAEVKVSGEGMRPNQDLTVTYEDKLVLIKSGDAKTDSAGKFSSTIVVPESTAGSHEITVSDVTGNKPNTWFTVNPTISLPDSAELGDTVQISGSGFGAGVDITVSVGGQPISTLPPIISTNQKGSFNNANFVLPQPAGTVKVTVSDEVGNKFEKTMNALPASVGTAGIALQPATSQGSPGYVGQKITVSGSKFSQSSSVTITYGNDQTQVASAKTDASGAFEADFNVPAGKAGQWTVAATDGANRATAVFVLESNPPLPPQPLVPGVVSGAKPTTRFDWTDLTDPSGVKYDLEVASDSTFATPLLEKTGLVQSEYTLAESERLQLKDTKAGYYWRVRAVDGAGNAGQWSVPILFFVGSATSPMPQWIIYAVIGLGAVVLVVLGLWLRRYIAERRM